MFFESRVNPLSQFVRIAGFSRVLSDEAEKESGLHVDKTAAIIGIYEP